MARLSIEPATQASGLLSRRYSRPERLADAIVHVAGVAFGFVACVAMAIAVLPNADFPLLASLGLYGTGLLAMLGCSAIYSMTENETWRRLDHAAIFVMIAGTYTPFTVIAIGGAWGVSLLVFVWSVATAGVVLKLLDPGRFRPLSIAAYLILGWTVLVAVEPLTASVSTTGIMLLVTGGVLYSVGVVFYLWTGLRYHRVIWHMLVLTAVICHYATIIGEVAVTVDLAIAAGGGQPVPVPL